MTTYTAIADTDIDADSPGTAALFTLLRDNPIAIAEGASGAPKIYPQAFNPPAGSWTTYWEPAYLQATGFTNGSAAKKLEYLIPIDCTLSVRTSGTGAISTQCRYQIYVSGVAAGTLQTSPTNGTNAFTEDIALNAGDLLQLYAYITGSNACSCRMTYGAAQQSANNEVVPTLLATEGYGGIT